MNAKVFLIVPVFIALWYVYKRYTTGVIGKPAFILIVCAALAVMLIGGLLLRT